MKIIVRVYYEHATNKETKNTYVDFELSPNQSKVTYIELREVIPEHSRELHTFYKNPKEMKV